MSELKQIRWKQRFSNFQKSYLLVEKYKNTGNPSELESAGMIQFFEMNFELAWKLLKDYLESQGIIANTPREVLKHSFQVKIIPNGHVWLDALERRNLAAHTYNEELARELLDFVRNEFFPELKQLYLFFRKHYAE